MATLSALSLMMLDELASRKDVRSCDAVVTVLYSAETLARSATNVWLVTVKSVSACTRSGADWLRFLASTASRLMSASRAGRCRL